jgi:GntR family transcriptional regulator
MNIHLHINPNSGVALFRQIAHEIQAACLRGELKPGDRLPSVRELAAHLGLNPTTIVKAYDLLENERRIHRRQGQGAFVAEGKQPLLPGEGEAIIAELAHQLALEGRRLGWSEEQIAAALERALAKLRPERSA